MKAFILANLSDAISTIFGLNHGGTEANPVISFVIEATSVPEALLVKLALSAAVGLLMSRWRPRLLSTLTLVFALIAISNSLVGLSYL